MPSLGPSETLLKAMMGGAIDWKTFTRRYHEELFLTARSTTQRANKNHGQKSALRLLRALGRKQNVTLICHCVEDAEECHPSCWRKKSRGLKGLNQTGANFRRRDFARVRLAGDAMPDRRNDSIDGIANRHRFGPRNHPRKPPRRAHVPAQSGAPPSNADQTRPS